MLDVLLDAPAIVRDFYDKFRHLLVFLWFPENTIPASV